MRSSRSILSSLKRAKSILFVTSLPRITQSAFELDPVALEGHVSHLRGIDTFLLHPFDKHWLYTLHLLLSICSLKQ